MIYKFFQHQLMHSSVWHIFYYDFADTFCTSVHNVRNVQFESNAWCWPSFDRKVLCGIWFCFVSIKY